MSAARSSTTRVGHALVTGATGVIGGALVPALLSRGWAVRCLVRDPARLGTPPWREDVEVVVGAVEDERAVARAAQGCRIAYYLVHGLAGPLSTVEERERRGAASFREAVAGSGLARIVYLGGLVDEPQLHRASTHLYARAQVGAELRAGSVPVTELRAGIVLTPASASVRLLVAAARAALQVWGPWAASRVQPIALDDLVRLLILAADEPGVERAILDVGGPDVVSYEQLVGELRLAAGRRVGPALRSAYLPIEVAATVAARRAGIPANLALALLQSSATDAIVRDGRAAELWPDVATTPLHATLPELVSRR